MEAMISIQTVFCLRILFWTLFMLCYNSDILICEIIILAFAKFFFPLIKWLYSMWFPVLLNVAAWKELYVHRNESNPFRNTAAKQSSNGCRFCQASEMVRLQHKIKIIPVLVANSCTWSQIISRWGEILTDRSVIFSCNHKKPSEMYCGK